MLQRYRSEYPNSAHQLFVTPSKHLFVLKDGRLKEQDKAIEVKLEKVASAEREHLVHYIVADHTSAAFYAEVRSSKQLQSPVEFLRRAWQRKDDYFFHGLPAVISVPAAITRMWPELELWLHQMGVVMGAPSSGFQAGVHQVRHWEKDLANSFFAQGYFKGTPATLGMMDELVSKTLVQSNRGVLGRNGIKKSRQELWETPRDGFPPIRILGPA